jgi:hypothetical protein
MSTPREMQAGMPQGSVLFPTLYNLYINDALQTPGVYLALFADDTCLFVTERKEGFVVRKLQRGLSSTETWCDSLKIKLIKKRHRGCTSLVDVDGLSLITDFMNENSICKQRTTSRFNLRQDYMETANRNDGSEGLQNIYESLFPIEK